MRNIGFRILLLFFDIFSILYSIADIEFNGIFIHYCITLFTIFMSIMNIIRIEYLLSLKNDDLTNSKFIFFIIENISKISFLFHSIHIEYNNLYTMSILILNVTTILFGIMTMITILYSIRAMCSIKSKQIIHPVPQIEANNTKIEIYSLNECSICLEINYNKITKTDCEHEFHEKCLLEWMKISKTCPICRKNLN
jgi:hypothetical protein